MRKFTLEAKVKILKLYVWYTFFIISKVMNLIIYEKINLIYTLNLSNLISETEIKNNKYFYRFIHFLLKFI